MLYRLNLRLRYGAGRCSMLPAGALPNGVLQATVEYLEATSKGQQLCLPLHRAPEKNWDHLAAVYAIAGATGRTARVLDAGAEFYSNVLPALFAGGYRELYGINLSYTDKARRGPIQYLPGDITRTEFPDGYFDAVTCMSVIEHGVPLEPYFREMFRVLKPGGLLITSTDYWEEPIDTTGKMAYGNQVKVFDRAEIEAMIALAVGCGFETTGELDLSCDEKPCCWREFELEFTYVIFTLKKPVQSS